MNWPLFHVFGGSFLQVDEMSGEVKIDQDGPPTVWSGLSMVEWCQLKLVAAYGKCLHISSQKTSINMGGWRYRLFHEFERVLFHFFWFQGLNVDFFLPTWTTMVIFRAVPGQNPWGLDPESQGHWAGQGLRMDAAIFMVGVAWCCRSMRI